MKSLYEGLLDIDDIDKSVEQSVVGEWLKTYCKVLPKVMPLKNGNMKISGDLKIKGCKDLKIPGLRIEHVRGSVYIDDCDFESLEGMFADMAKVTGSVYITNCPNLKNLIGSPWSIEDELSVSNCKSFDSVEGGPALVSYVQIMKCKKRFNKSTIQKTFRAAVQIFCSEEEECANITEAMQDPVLIRFWDQVRALKSGIKMPAIVGNGYMIDKISPSNRQTFKPDDKAVEKAVRAVLGQGKNSVYGFILLEDYDGNFPLAYNGYRQISRWIINPKNRNYYVSKTGEDIIQGVQTAMSKFKSDLSQFNIAKVHVYNIDHRELGSLPLSNERMHARSGAVAMYSEDQLKDLLREQQARYKKALTQIKALRSTDKYKDICKKVEDIMTRFTKAMSKYVTDPSWAKSIDYKFSFLCDAIRKGYQPNSKFQEYGVIYSFQLWSSNVVKAATGQSTSSDPMATSYYEMLQKAINRAEKRLSDIGM